LRNSFILREVPLVNVLFRFLSLYISEDDINVNELKELLVQNVEFLDDETFKSLFGELYNWCKDKQASGNTEFGKISFQLIKEMLERGIFYQSNNYITDHTYINLVASALRVGEVEWAEDFIKKYREKIVPAFGDNAFMYASAMLNYKKGRAMNVNSKILFLGRANEYLSKVKSEDFYYMTRMKNLSLQIHYELDDYELTDSLIDSYKHYLSRNFKIIPEELYERYSNFLNLLHKLLKMKSGSKTITPPRLRREIEATGKLEFRGWLLEKLSELKSTKI
jgi:hypothetical protein